MKLAMLVCSLLGHGSVFFVIVINLTLIVRCEHDKMKSADACLVEVIGEKNPEHFFVATQDVDLRKKFQEVSVTVYLYINGLFYMLFRLLNLFFSIFPETYYLFVYYPAGARCSSYIWFAECPFT